jgi:hypothetical protein
MDESMSSSVSAAEKQGKPKNFSIRCAVSYVFWIAASPRGLHGTTTTTWSDFSGPAPAGKLQPPLQHLERLWAAFSKRFQIWSRRAAATNVGAA